MKCGRIFLLLCVILTSFSTSFAAIFLDGKMNEEIGKSGDDLGTSISTYLSGVAPTGAFAKHTVAVLPFGDKDGKYTLSLGDNGPMLQTAISDRLRAALSSSAAAGKYLVHFPFQIKDQFKLKLQQGISPSGISTTDVSAARQVLKAEGYDVGIIGFFGLTEMPATGDVPITAIVITPTESKEFHSSISAQAMNSNSPSSNPPGNDPGSTFDPSSPGNQARERIVVSIAVKTNEALPDDNDSAWTKLPKFRITEPHLLEQYLVKIPIQYKGKRYRIEVKNLGFPAISTTVGDKTCIIENPDDEDRIFAAAVMVDGVSAFWSQQVMPNGDKVYVPDTRSHAKQPKRILTGNERMIQEANGGDSRIENGKLINAKAKSPGHSEISLVGFQRSFDFADAFIFGNAEDSPGAEFIGSINEIGLISVYAYAEKLPGDTEKIVEITTKKKVVAGTEVGERVPSPLFAIKVKNGFYNVPAAAIHILYRYEDCPSFPDHEPVIDFNVIDEQPL